MVPVDVATSPSPACLWWYAQGAPSAGELAVARVSEGGDISGGSLIKAEVDAELSPLTCSAL